MTETQNTGQFAKTIVTDVGKDMIAKSQNGQTLTFSRVALGDGLVGEEEDVTKFTAVKNERLSLPIAKYSNLGNGQFQIQFRLTNSQVESGFWHREIGIMAKIDNGQEQLYAYTTAGNKASFIYDKTTPVEERIVNVNFVIGNAQNLEVIINSSVIYATIEDLEEALDAHDAGTDAHEPAFDAHNAADDAHKDFTGATAKAAGKRGMVPAPVAGDQNKALFGDATYKQVVQKVNGVAPDSGGNVTVPIYTHPNSGVTAGTYRNVTVNAQGHVTAGNNPTISIAQGGTGATTAAQARTNLGITQANGNQIPTGSIFPFAGGTIPSGFLACNGAAVSRTTYAALFSAIGTTYGRGDGSTTFNLPNVEDNRFLEFSSTRGTKKNAGLPNITGEIKDGYQFGNSASAVTCTGAFAYGGNSSKRGTGDENSYSYNFSFNASRSSSIYGASTTVQPKSLTVRAIIKY